ncbi:MAG TPA: hypothetical protein VGQ59_01760, partial [Cyclobacteriaceae bacterium]|nr:hypothetical protein [Cyclobacteriaceae bacterium]
LVVNQIFVDEKEGFEKEVIQYVDSLETVLRLFVAGGSELNEGSKMLLKNRLDNELRFELLKNNTKRITKDFKSLLSKLKLDET